MMEHLWEGNVFSFDLSSVCLCNVCMSTSEPATDRTRLDVLDSDLVYGIYTMVSPLDI